MLLRRILALSTKSFPSCQKHFWNLGKLSQEARNVSGSAANFPVTSETFRKARELFPGSQNYFCADCKVYNDLRNISDTLGTFTAAAEMFPGAPELLHRP